MPEPCRGVGRGESETKVERGSARSSGLRLGVWTGCACGVAGAWGYVAERGRYSARVRPVARDGRRGTTTKGT